MHHFSLSIFTRHRYNDSNRKPAPPVTHRKTDPHATSANMMLEASHNNAKMRRQTIIRLYCTGDDFETSISSAEVGDGRHESYITKSPIRFVSHESVSARAESHGNILSSCYLLLPGKCSASSLFRLPLPLLHQPEQPQRPRPRPFTTSANKHPTIERINDGPYQIRVIPNLFLQIFTFTPSTIDNLLHFVLLYAPFATVQLV